MNPAQNSRPTVEFDCDPARWIPRLAITWFAIEFGLILLDYFGNFAGVHVVGAIRRLSNLGREDSLANLLAVIQVMLLALTLWAVVFTVRRTSGAGWQRRGWVVVACLFSYMAIDDGARLHERIGTAAGMMAEGLAASPGRSLMDLFPSYNWQVVFLPFFAMLGLFTLYFLWKELQPPYSRLLVFVGIGCFVAAVGMDFFEGLDEDSRFNPYVWIADRVDLTRWARENFHTTPYIALMHFSKVIEEVTEMFGTTLIWVAVLRHWTSTLAVLRIRFSKP